MPEPITIFLAIVILLGIVILVHEWGHFAAAKLFGVRVEVFSIGFGPRVWGRKRGDTDYRVSLLPVGGYVRMSGDNPMEERTEAPYEFLSKPRWQRAIIAAAGPAMNVLLAIGLMAALYFVGTRQPAFLDEPVDVAGILPGTPAEAAGIRAGDRLVEINGVHDPSWDKAALELALGSPGSQLPITVTRGSERLQLKLPLSTDMLRQGIRLDFQFLGYPEEPVVLGPVSRGMAADQAGLKEGDLLESLNGVPLLSEWQFRQLIQELKGQSGEVAVRRGEQGFTAKLQPRFENPDGAGARWVIGVAHFQPRLVERSYPLNAALRRSFWFNTRLTQEILRVVVQLFRRPASIWQLGGPVAIARQSAEAARQGPQDFVRLMAVISLNLAILNLLPIPILDGGHILMLSVEGLIRRDLSLAVKERFVQVGMAFLLLVFVFVMYNDLLKWLTGR